MVIAITGPTGAGKTTVAEELVKVLNKCANIDVDHLKHMNPSAFTQVINEDGDDDFPYSGWELLGENVGLLAKNFLANGYDVIINGYLELESWLAIERLIKTDHKLLLLPELDTNLLRDDGRTEEVKMGEKAVIRGREYFINTEYYRNFTTIDSTHQTAQETKDTIQEILKK